MKENPIAVCIFSYANGKSFQGITWSYTNMQIGSADPVTTFTFEVDGSKFVTDFFDVIVDRGGVMEGCSYFRKVFLNSFDNIKFGKSGSGFNEDDTFWGAGVRRGILICFRYNGNNSSIVDSCSDRRAF